LLLSIPGIEHTTEHFIIAINHIPGTHVSTALDAESAAVVGDLGVQSDKLTLAEVIDML